ncbi:protein kinase domain-containing protein [Frankia sp. CiP1_Cm_nod1]
MTSTSPDTDRTVPGEDMPQPNPPNTPDEAGRGREPVFTPLSPEDPREIGTYPLWARIGEGGMGIVYLSHTPGGRQVALKVAWPGLATDPEFRRRFEEEVKIAQRVLGLYTAPVIACDPHAPRPWLATAYIAAPSLAVTVTRHGPLPAETVLLLIAGVAEALQSIHDAGVIHRDLKPSNIILAADGPRVIDFGISRAIEAAQTKITQTGVRIGTPAFMAPEQAQGVSLSTSGDIFSLGSTAYYAITGRLPFGGDAAVSYRIVHGQPDWDSCPDRVRDVLERCMEKDPTARPTPAELIELCRAASTDERLRIDENWLPPTVVADLSRYDATPPRPSDLPKSLKLFSSFISSGPSPDEFKPPQPAPDTPEPPGRPGRKRLWWIVSGCAAVVLAMVTTVLIIRTSGGNAPSDEAAGSPRPFVTEESGQSRDTSTAPVATGGITLHSNRFGQGMCLDADINYQGVNGTRVQLWTCNGSVQQQWYYEGDLHTGALIHSVKWPGMCLDADTNTIGSNGGKVQLWMCNGFAQQRWYYRNTAGANAYQNGWGAPYGRCLDADSNAGWDGTRVQLWECNQTTQQQWRE